MKLSKHLSLEEVTISDTAKRLGIKNEPTEQHISNLELLAENIFEPIREHFNVPIYVSSGYRSKKLNDAVPGSSKTSQHSKGEALDLDQDGHNSKVTNKDIFEFIKGNLEFDQLIWEFGDKFHPDWVHVSFSTTKKQRKQVLQSIRTKGVVTYKII